MDPKIVLENINRQRTLMQGMLQGLDTLTPAPLQTTQGKTEPGGARSLLETLTQSLYARTTHTLGALDQLERELRLAALPPQSAGRRAPEVIDVVPTDVRQGD